MEAIDNPSVLGAGVWPVLPKQNGPNFGAFYGQRAHRLLTHLLLALFMFLAALLGLAIYKGVPFWLRKLSFVCTYGVHIAILFSLCQLGIDLLAGQWGRGRLAYTRRGLREQWLILLAGFLVAFAVHRLTFLHMVDYYEPWLTAYYQMYPQKRPDHLAIFLFCLPLWAGAVAAALKVARLSQGNTDSPPFGALWPPALPSLPRSVRPLAGPTQQPEPARRPEAALSLQVNGKRLSITHRDITHVSVEDHYCRIHYLAGGKLQNSFVRMPLKELRQMLPEPGFVQTHRSHLVHLGHATSLAGLGRNRTLVVAGGLARLPVSRRRLERLRAYLDPLPEA